MQRQKWCMVCRANRPVISGMEVLKSGRPVKRRWCSECCSYNLKPKRDARKVLKKLHAKAWGVFSLWVREQSYGICVTCRKRFEVRELDAGHFVHGKLDFDEMNVNAQCTRCNRFLHGNLGAYAMALVQKHGIVAVEDLRLRANIKGNAYSEEELQAIIQKYSS
jgi:hypothetical protein